MSGKAELRVFTYDIADDRRRRKIAGVLEERAARVQESVFETRLSAGSARQLLADVQALTGPGDSIRMYTIPDQALGKCETPGGASVDGGGAYWIL